MSFSPTLPRPVLRILILSAFVSASAGRALAGATPVPPTATPAATVTPTPVGTVVVITPSADNSLFEDMDGALSNGAGEYLFTGLAGDLFRRGLLKFDVAAAVPGGMEILSVELWMNMSRTISGDSDVSLHRLTADWGEGASDAFGQEGMGAPSEPGDVTWIHTFYDTAFWATAGGDFAASPSATTPVGFNGPYTWGSTPDMVADVQGWLDSPGQNFGWIFLGDEVNLFSAKRFDSRENADPALRPMLTIRYDVAPPAPTATATPTPGATPTPAPCCPGDADNSGGAVNANDFLAVQGNFGANNGLGGLGDADCSGGAVNANDFLSVQANFGANCD